MLRVLSKLTVALSILGILASCGSTATEEGLRLIEAPVGAAMIADSPEDLRIVDLRTPEEFSEGHLENAEMIDFYRTDFESQIADLPRDEPYMIYCRSGNRSGHTRLLMEELGFTDVAELDGGVLAWQQAGNALVSS